MLRTIVNRLSGVNRTNLHKYLTKHRRLLSIEANFQESLTEEQKEREKKLKILALEVDVLRQEGRKAPDPALLKPQHWEYLLGLNSRSARKKYFSYLWQNEKKLENKIIKKEEKRQEIEELKETRRQEVEDNPHITYGLAHNSIFLRIYDSTMNLWSNNKLVSQMLFGQKLILDCSYDEYMNTREALNAAKQLMYCFAENRIHDEPFDLHYCNVNLKSQTSKQLERYIPGFLDTSFPINIHTESYMDLFPKEKLVYLTPHCFNDLEEFSYDDYYIIGGMVDKVNNEPLSLAKAKKLGLRMARLPLDRHLQWGSGSGKSLTLNQMVNILLDMKTHGDWNKALRFVPRRKVVDERREYLNQQESRKDYRDKKENKNYRGHYTDDRDFQNFRENKENRERNQQRAHSEKFKFNLDTWGSKNNKR